MSARHSQSAPSDRKATNELDLNLWDKQAAAFASVATELLYGGAAGGGKSHLMRVVAILWCAAIPGLQVYIFRRMRGDLFMSHMDGPKGFRAMLAGWVIERFVRIVGNEIRFWNGSKIYLCHCKSPNDIYKYQGAEIHVLLIDELTHFTEAMYRFLRGRVRMVGLKDRLPEWAKGLFPRILCGANPGNIGHLWVKKFWIDGAQPHELRPMPPEEGGKLRQYIPAVLEDNPSMLEDDPTYEHTLSGLGNAELVKAMRDGDWNIAIGAFFSAFNERRHVVKPFTIPKDWTRFVSKDWGGSSPGSVGWWTIVQDRITVPGKVDGTLITLPRGAIVRYREWYIAKPGGTNEGLKLRNAAVAKGIKEREKGETITYRTLDPSAFAERGGPSITEDYANEGVHFVKADNERVAGWSQMNSRLVGDDDGNPMIACFSTCVDSIRTIPVLMHDKHDPEDVDTDMEDHAADDWRYACMSRSWLPTPVKKPSALDAFRKGDTPSGTNWKTI